VFFVLHLQVRLLCWSPVFEVKDATDSYVYFILCHTSRNLARTRKPPKNISSVEVITDMCKSIFI